MKSSPAIWIALVLLIGSGMLRSQTVTISSRSGQFIISGPPVVGTALNTVDLNSPRVLLDPALLAISCERIKARLLELLDWSDQWQSTITATIDPSFTDAYAIMVQAKRYADGWQYRLRFPSEVDRRHFIKTMVEMMLLEMANRNSQSRPVELPPWLAEGLTSILAVEGLSSLTLSPQVTLAHQISVKDPMASVKKVLGTRPPLTLDELNWPKEDDWSSDQDEVYEMCAHLMVSELLRLENGSWCLARMLELLPAQLNWQTAFFGAFHERFPRMIEWDKWWSLLLVNIANRDLFAAWSPSESWSKFDEILNTPVQVRVSERDLPMTAQASLQSIVQEWEHRRQIELLTLKLNHLNALRVRAAQETVGLVDDYRGVLSDYLRERSRPGLARRILPGIPDELVQRTVNRLNELDQRKAAVRRLLDVAKSNPAPPAP